MTIDQALQAAELAIDEIAEQMLDKLSDDLRDAGAPRAEILALRERGFQQARAARAMQLKQVRTELAVWLAGDD
jgi:hypothetical protein